MTTIVPTAPTIAASAAAEWLKLRSLRSTAWFVAGSSLIMLLVAVLEADDGDPSTIRALSVASAAISYFIQYSLATFGMLAITGEFASRSITVTLACTPSRTRVMLAKALVVGAAVLLVGTGVSAVGAGVAAARFGELGSLRGTHVAGILAMGVYLSLLALLALGIGTVVRRTAGGLSIVIVLLLVVPELLRMASARLGVAAFRTFADLTPAPAGSRFVAGEWEYGLVLLAWAAAGLAAGTWALRMRDA
jgi:ABC-2 type transport system permease protein